MMPHMLLSTLVHVAATLAACLSHSSEGLQNHPWSLSKNRSHTGETSGICRQAGCLPIHIFFPESCHQEDTHGISNLREPMQ